MSLLEQREKKQYVYILSSDGSLRQAVEEGTLDSVRREYETSDGKKGVKHELVFSKLEGKITNVAFWLGDYGRNLQIEVENGNERAVLSLGVESSFGEDVMKKLSNVDLEKEVSFEPFSFENDKGKLVKGVSIKQNGVKIQNAYWDAEKKEVRGGIPKVEGNPENYSKDDWKIYFLQVRKFLVGETEKLIAEKFPQAKADETAPLEPVGDEELDPRKIPF